MTEDNLLLKNIYIILVNPQMGENIGTVARAMKNFAIPNLRIVSPRDGWPNEKAKQCAVGAINIIEEAQIYNSLLEAISDLEYLYAAAATPRNMNKQLIYSHKLVDDSKAYKKIGIMFGRESSGLNNEEISYANKIVSIETNKDFSSLNLAHSVAVICSQLFQKKNNQVIDHLKSSNFASVDDLEHFYNHLFSALEQNSFFRHKNKTKHMIVKFRNLFGRIEHLSKQEIQMLRGVLSLIKKVK